MSELTVHLVASDRMVWRGQATLVVLETLNGQIGIMAKHAPLMAILADAPLLIRTPNGDKYAAVHGGFVTVDGNQVIVLAETAELGEEIVVEAAQRIKSEIGTPSEDDVAAQAKLRRAEVRLDVAAKSQTGSMRR